LTQENVTMIEDKSQSTESHIEKTGQLDAASDDERRASVVADNTVEHELTFREVARNHKPLIWWSFYFAMCAIGW
jgi:hypothetical protein